MTTFNYNNSPTINNNNNNTTNNNFNTTIMLSAIFSLSFVIILVIILHIYVPCALRLHHRHITATSRIISSHQLRHIEPTPINTGLDPTVINSLPSHIVSRLDSHDDDNNVECTVCLTMLESDDVARKLPNCDHIFHVKCIDTWLIGQSTCPICRSDVVPRLKLLDREPPIGGEDIIESCVNDCEGIAASLADKVVNINGSGPSSSSSFRLRSFRKIIGRDRSSRRVHANVEVDLERQE